jgi:hypothetical protein
MKLTIHLEIDERVPQSGTATSAVASASDFSQRDLPCRISANFVAQLAAAFLRCPQTCTRRRIDFRDAIQIYDNAESARLMPTGTAIYCKA